MKFNLGLDKGNYRLGFTLDGKFLPGVRPGEAIALQWKHIDFEKNLIATSEARGRDLESPPYASRKVRKETKTGK